MLPHTFEQETYDRFARSIQSWDTVRDDDIYAISILIDSCGNSIDSRGREVSLSRITLSYNTLQHFESQMDRASSLGEAKWNYAFWLQNSTEQMPRDFDYGTDPPAEDYALRDAWCASLGIEPWQYDEAGHAIYAGRFEEETFLLCSRFARALHDNGVILGQLGRAVPILVHELSCSDWSVELTKDANPPGLTDEADSWTLSRYR